MEEKIYMTIWDSKNHKPYITICQSNLQPIYSIEFKNTQERNDFLLKEAKNFYIELYKPQEKLVQLKSYLKGLIEDGYYGIEKATTKRIKQLTETIQGIENFLKIKNNEV